MTSEEKYICDTIEEELSTSAGSSDNELSPTSGDEEPLSHSTTSGDNVKSAKTRRLTTDRICFLLNSLFKLFTCFSTLISYITSKPKPQRPAHALNSNNRPRGRVQLVQRPQRAHKFGTGKPLNQATCRVPPPPGLNVRHSRRGKECSVVENQRSILNEVGPPPGLEGFLPPPGLQPTHAAIAAIARGKQPKHVSSGDKRGRKQPPIGSPPSPPVRPQAVPQVPPPSPLPLEPREFDQSIYRKELSDVLRSLATPGSGGNVATGVQRIRVQNVPKEKQAAEFADILTRAAEDNRGVVRRLSFAFAVGLMVDEKKSAFDREECERGLEFFFLEVFDDLASEVPRLRNKIANEMVPTLRTAFTEEQLGRIVPPDCRAVLSR